MADQRALHDANNVPTLLGVDDVTGELRQVQVNSSGRMLVSIAGGGSGDVSGPASSTDKAIARFNGTGGKTIQNSGVTISDTNAVVIPSTLRVTGIVTFANQAATAITGSERIIVEDADGNLSDWSFRVAGNSYGVVNFASSGGTLSVPTVSASGNILGEIDFYGYDGSAYKTAGTITCNVDATPGANDMPGNFIFSLSPDGSTTPAEVFRLSNNKLATFSGNVVLASGKTINGLTITTTTGTLTVTNGKTLSVTNDATLSGTNTGDQTITLSGDVTGSGATAITTTVAKIAGTTVSGTTGSGNVVFATTPTLTTPVLGAATGTSVVLAGAAAISSFSNTSDSASLQVIKLIGARATPAANDEIYESYFLNSSTGVTREFARVTAKGTTVTNTAEVGSLRFSVMVAGSLTGILNVDSTAISPTSNDGAALGTTSLKWSDVFLASGAVVNFNAGNMTLTHAAGSLTFAGGNVLGLGAATATSLATSAASPLLLTNGQLVTVALTSQTVGGATLTIPDFANVNDEFTFKTKAQTMSNKTFVAPVLGAATATTINGLAITSNGTNTLNIAAGKTVVISNGITFAGTDSTTMTFPTTNATIARIDAGQTFTGTQVMTTPTITTSLTTGSSSFDLINTTATTVNFAGAATTMAIGASTALITVAGNIIQSNNAITASSNAATVPITHRMSTVTNDSAGNMTITITTTSAVDRQLLMVCILDFSAVAKTITWVNTENSTVTAPTTSNGSTTLPLTVGFQYNNATSKWRCIASA